MAQEYVCWKGQIFTDLENVSCVIKKKKKQNNPFTQPHRRVPSHWLAAITRIFSSSNPNGLCSAFSIFVSSDPAKFPIFHPVT